ncbi:MAG: pyridoxamine 5'-phosphate oxidase [Saprospiraceae bacterium]
MKVNNQTIAALREDYRAKTLEIVDVHTNPIQQFNEWFQEALDSQIKEANAMTIATVDAQGKPAARIVLLKGFDENGFIFYTNYDSRKGQELAANPNIAVVFLWKDLERQIRIEGIAEKVAPAVSLNYFQSRPKGSQIGAWASPQSQVIPNRSILEQNVLRLKEKYKDADNLPIPSHWGGYQIKPTLIEFWQGRSSRLHDRLSYTLIEKEWKIERLAP